MEIDRVQLLYFTGAGTTRTIGRAVAGGTGLPVAEWDCTPLEAKAPFQPDGKTLTILAVPSFGGRIPGVVAERLRQMRGCGPAVLISVYGSRASEDTLVELYDRAKEVGYIPIAAGEFVAQHSMAPTLAAGRPNQDDCVQAADLGRRALGLAERLPAETVPVLELPGNRPYRAFGGVALHPKAGKNCIACGRCVENCPVGAIPRENPRQTDAEKCITCMRCVAECPQQARGLGKVAQAAVTMKLGKVCDAKRLNQVWFANV